MLHTYIKSLIENIPPEQVASNTSNVNKLDIVLDGGAFNGIYMLGSLYYIKELEEQNKITIERVSGCSIGAFLGAMYLLNRLDLAKELTIMCIMKIRKHQDLKQMMKLFKHTLSSSLSESDLSKCNKRFYLTYFDTNKGRQIVKKSYNSVDDLIDSIIKSMYVPYLIDRNIVDKDGCIDGAFPYMFKKNTRKKILFINLQGLNKIFKMVYIKNEKNIYPRLMEGLHDIHNFICTGDANSLCSYVNDWNITDIFYFRIRESLYTLIFYLFRTILQLEQFIPKQMKNKNIIKQNAFILKNLWNDIIIYMSVQ